MSITRIPFLFGRLFLLTYKAKIDFFCKVLVERIDFLPLGYGLKLPNLPGYQVISVRLIQTTSYCSKLST